VESAAYQTVLGVELNLRADSPHPPLLFFFDDSVSVLLGVIHRYWVITIGRLSDLISDCAPKYPRPKVPVDSAPKYLLITVLLQKQATIW
jgi:hypothetical protein